MNANLFRLLFMRPRPDWNRRGPKLPAWWRAGLKRIDPLLDMQFMPAASWRDPDGVDREKYPHGVWVVVRRLRWTRLLHKRWVWCLTDEHGNYRAPGKDSLRLLLYAFRAHRTGDSLKIERAFDRSLSQLKAAKSEESKARLSERVASAMRRMGMPNTAGGRIFNPWGGNGSSVSGQAI